MIPPKIHNFIQIWSKKTGTITWKETFIETPEGEKEMRLVVTFESGEHVRTFHLGSDISSVLIGRGRERRSCLCLTLQDSTSLLMGRPSCLGVGQPGTFLDVCHLHKFQIPMKLESGWFVLEGRKAQVAAGHEPPYGSCGTQIRSGALPSRKTPLPVWKPPALGKKVSPERKGEKRKKVLPSGLEVNEGDLVPTKKRKRQPWTCAGGSRERPLSLGDAGKDRSSSAEPAAGPDPGEAASSTPTLSDPKRLAVPLGAEHSQQSGDAQAAAQAPAEQRRGFPNLGNTCYMNAVLQALFAIPSFADGLLSQGVPWERIPAGALLTPMSLLLLLKDVCQVETKEELLAGIKGAVSAVAEAFLGNQQNDAHEFLGQCLHQLKDEFEKLNTTWNTEGEPWGGNPPPQGAAGQAVTRAFTCPVEANFEFETQISITCKVCGWVVVKTEPSNHLSLDLQQGLQQGTEPPPLSVQSALDLFFAAEELEYSCERCRHRSAVLRCGFRRLPQVLIVHLKRYSFNQAWLLVKSDRQVGISKYLTLSSQCNADTAPPRPLARSAQATSELTTPPSASVPLGSESPDSLVPLFGPDRDAGPQEFQRMWEGASPTERQRGQQAELASRGSRVFGQKRPRADSAVAEEGRALPPTPGGRAEPVGTPDSALSDVRLQEVPENPEPQKTDPEGIQRCPEKDVGGPTESRLQEADPKVCSASDLDQSPERQDTADNAVAEARGPDATGLEGPPQAYRLVSVVSHVGRSHRSGHYISDVYDFEKQTWFMYNDLRVSEIPEAVMQELRTHTGYILFYMHNEIFEALLEKAESSQELSAQAEVIPWGDV
uniref:Ubiquitin carboxyl-terminal hydrolase n=1 Tax=Sciurus vulgaris TaxID=55149 RepID=A0A8D2E0J2_SCIVU